MIFSDLSYSNNRITIIGLAVILCGVFFYFDYITPLGYSGGTPYVLVILLCTLSNKKEELLIFCGLSTILIIAGFLLSAYSAGFYKGAVANRGVAIACLWFTTLFCLSYISSKQILIESEGNSLLILDANPTALVLTNNKGVIERVNQRACELFGYERDEITGQNIELLIPEKYRKQHVQVRTEYNKSPKKRLMAPKVDLYARAKDGREFPVEIELSPIKLASEEVKVIASVKDISERKKQIELLETSAEKLRASNSYLEQFAYIASHDLQEPLRMVSSYTQLLASKYHDKLDEDANEFIGFAVDGAKRMQLLIQDLLRFSRLGTDALSREPVNINEIITIVLANLVLMIEESQAEIRQDNLPVVDADKSQLLQLFQNLIANSIKYRSPDRVCKIHISATQVSGRWQFCIQDNGIGIEPQYFDRIFAIFRRLHNNSEYEGTGIGLALCKRIVNTHEGEIWVESEYGEGTRFYFTL